MTADFTSTALTLAAVPVCSVITLSTTRGMRYLLAASDQRPVIRAAWRIRRTWRRTAMRVGLAHTEPIKPHAPVGTPGSGRRTLVPAIRVHRETWGVRIDAYTVGRLGVEEFEAAADHLANAWRVPLVRVEQHRPGVVRIRALLRDPLTQPTTFTEQAAGEGDPLLWVPGIDADGQPVTLRSSGVSGVVVAGLAGYGKTSLLNARFCALAPSPAVQFVLIDGKGGPDYDELFARAWLHAKDDLEQVSDILATIHRLMTQRQKAIRSALGVKNMWHLGPSATWPLVVVVVDEAHTFFNESKGGDAQSKRRDALAREIVRLVEELVRKGRNVGIQVVLATQKATGDAIPTKIRDNCQVAISFAQRTSEAATAALGSDISEHPHAHPRRLQDAAYIGVASMVAEGRPGFTLVRTPYVADQDAERIAAATAHLVTDPLALLAGHPTAA
ncbi:FtsK/SpoIIIE domain-containing protein [Streptacidiphilus albus]|uniref:FtsK/SpoIIIE domain-containing protein n=1 Tax=Streptacidiphilus albus TaxID=105425 RepID=UPI00054B89ED|nr:FtsK/SpoIIIE domain-containing protein [Streptacidiphilus albus]